MSWDGYFTYAGQEFINVSRTEQYAKHAGAYWFKGCSGNTDLGPMLGENYRSALQDPAPWTDPDAPESYGFYGVYPLEVTGLEDSTRAGTVVESISDGGTVGRIRHATRTVVFNVLLAANSDCAADYGLRWLRRLLLGAACSVQSTEACSGADLCYLSCEPLLDWQQPGTPIDVLDCIDPYLRSLRRVVFNVGPVVTAKRTTNDGGVVWTATFTGVAGNPWEFTAEKPIVEGFGLAASPYVCEPPGIVFSTETVVDDDACRVTDNLPVFDPSCPAFIPPPAPVTVPLGCYTPPKNWRRRQFTIPEEFIPLWGEVVPKIEIHAMDPAKPVRNLRLRFYANVDRKEDLEDEDFGDECAYCGDIVVSYIPVGQTLVIDGSDQLIYVEAAGGTGQRRADSLVFSTDGTPMEWPVLSCGFSYIVAVDTEQTANLPSVDLSLFARAV